MYHFTKYVNGNLSSRETVRTQKQATKLVLALEDEPGLVMWDHRAEGKMYSRVYVDKVGNEISTVMEKDVR